MMEPYDSDKEDEGSLPKAPPVRGFTSAARGVRRPRGSRMPGVKMPPKLSLRGKGFPKRSPGKIR